MVVYSARIQDPRIQTSLHKNLKRRSSHRGWRLVWLLVLILLISAGIYGALRFKEYGIEKAQALVQEGQALEGQFDLTSALQKYETAIALQIVAKESAAEAASLGAQIYLSKGQQNQGLDLLRQAVDIRPDQDSHRAALVIALIRANLIDEAKGVLADLDENSRAALAAARARLELAQNNREQAKDILGEITKASNDVDSLFIKAILYAVSEPKDSLDKLGRAKEISENSESVKKYDAIINVINDLEGDDEAKDRVTLATVLIENGEFDLAISELMDVLANDKEYRDARLFLANAEFLKYDLTAAHDSIQAALTVDPTYTYSRYLSGQIAMSQGDIESAAQDFETAIDLGHEDPQLIVDYSEALIALGESDKAEDLLESSLKDSPRNPSLIEALFWLYINDGRENKAADLAKDSERNNLQALALVLDGDEKNGLRLADEVLTGKPLSPYATLAKALAENNADLRVRATDLDFKGYITDYVKSLD